MFDKHDKGKLGYLTDKELPGLLAEIGLTISSADAFTNAMNMLNLKGDGHLTFDEIVYFSTVSDFDSFILDDKLLVSTSVSLLV